MASMLRMLVKIARILLRNPRRSILTGLFGSLLLIGAVCGWAWLSYLAFQAKGAHEQWWRCETREYSRLRKLKLVMPRWTFAPDPAAQEMYAELPFNRRINPIVKQLWSTDIEGQLSLHENGTGAFPGKRYWIYFAGTAAEISTPWWHTGAYFKSMLNHSSLDPPEMAKAYNEAMIQLSEYLHDERRRMDTMRPIYRFADCDQTPGLCDLLMLDPPALVYLEVKNPCRLRSDPYEQVCSAIASVVGLPLQQLPYRPTQIIGGNVVPVFPSPFEELKMMMTSVDTIDAMGLEGDSIRYVAIDRQNVEDDEYGYPIIYYESFLYPRWQTLVLGLGRLLGYV